MEGTNERLYCIRGAVCAENTAESITANVGLLCKTLFEKNNLDDNCIVSIQFTITPDLDTLNPATAFRRFNNTKASASIPLFCAAEPVIKNMKQKVIRVMVNVYKPRGFIATPVYVHGAESLRPDLSQTPRNC